MTMTDPGQLGPQDFDECFRGEPAPPDATQDLLRGRRRRHQRSAALGTGVVAVVAAVTAATVTSSSPPEQVVVVASPAATSPTPSPSTRPIPVPAGPGPQADTAPGLRRSSSGSYVDRDGRKGSDLSPDGAPFSATTRHTYDLVRRHLDPQRRHLGAYERDSFSGGGGSSGIEIGQKLSWRVKGDPGQGMLLVAVTRAAPGKQVVTKGDDRDGLCAGTFGDASCKPTTVDGHEVFLDRQAGGGFVVDYVQPDGELASAWVDPLFGNNTDLPLEKMGVSLSDVVHLLADPDLDVVG